MKAWTFLVVLALAACSRDGEKPDSPTPPAPTVQPAAASAASAKTIASAKPELTAEQRAQALAKRFIILDGHIDVPWRLYKGKNAQGEPTEDVSQATKEGNFDFPRARAGGLDAPFFSIYVPAKYEAGGAKKIANQLIDMVDAIIAKSPDKFVAGRSPADVRKAHAQGKIAILMGMENGSPIERKLDNVRHFYERGIRYITLAHSRDNHIADSSYDGRGTHHGLSKFGEKVVAEMNRLGILVDVSHISDDAFEDVMRVSSVPVIASHSSCRHFTPGWPRNMSDPMLKELAAKGGVIQINFGSDFIDGELQKQNSKRYKELKQVLAAKGLSTDDDAAEPVKKQFWEKFEKRFATVDQVADHIDHVVKLIGIDHVGLGSDFDGVGDTLPTGLKDVSGYPNLIRVLLERGYSERDIEKLCAGNVLRVWDKVESHAAAAKAEATP